LQRIWGFSCLRILGLNLGIEDAAPEAQDDEAGEVYVAPYHLQRVSNTSAFGMLQQLISKGYVSPYPLYKLLDNNF
jgi:hypothetical protein